MATTVGPTVSELLRNSRFEILPERWRQRTLNRLTHR
jgi:hypothetical protein